MEDTQNHHLAVESRHGHPMLRGGRRGTYKHGFSHAQMESLAAICDTLIPSIPTENSPQKPADKDVESFYLLSGSQNGVPTQVAELIAKRVKSDGLLLARVTLWLLWTRLGTFILCGSASIKKEFPYLQSFPEIPQAKREQILLSWSRGSRFSFMKFFFKIFKICTLYIFYSMVDENAQNPTWNAIGYSPPAPNKSNSGRQPLDRGVIDACSSPGKNFPSLFQGTGFTVTEENLNGKKVWKIECDAVVIGSGSGGGVAAGVLAKAGYRVIVLEKGKYYARDDLTQLEGPSMDQMYESGGILSTNDTKVHIMAGSTVGGGSVINWSASIRTPPHVLKEWGKQHDLPLFESQEYQNAMNMVCERLGVQEGCERENFQNSVLRKGCAKLGYNVENVPRNAPENHFCGSCCFGCRTGAKKGTDETWLVDAVEAGALILAGCRAEKVVHRPNIAGLRRAVAVGVVARLDDGGGERIFVQAKVTVTACGSMLTPPLLRASGLRNPNIGKNLRLHPVQMAWGYFPEGEPPDGKSYEGGIITAICKEGARWGQSGYGSINQTPALGPGSFAALVPWISGADMKARMRRYDRTAHVFALVRDRGNGSVMREKDVEYRLAESDRETMLEGLGRALRILIAAGATEVGTHRSDGFRLKVAGATEDDVEEFLRGCTRGRNRSVWSTSCSAHQMGSCRMGRDDVAGGVDWKGESWEVEGLFVCDGSVLPTAVGVNPMITIQSVALCISNAILQFLRNKKN
eukprot:Gb_33032 [translate_table: standard]